MPVETEGLGLLDRVTGDCSRLVHMMDMGLGSLGRTELALNQLSNPLTLFKKSLFICINIMSIYVYLHVRNRDQIPLKMVVSHHMVTGI